MAVNILSTKHPEIMISMWSLLFVSPPGFVYVCSLLTLINIFRNAREDCILRYNSLKMKSNTKTHQQRVRRRIKTTFGKPGEAVRDRFTSSLLSSYEQSSTPLLVITQLYKKKKSGRHTLTSMSESTGDK